MAEALRPLTLGELLDRSFTIFRRNFLLYAGLSALPGLLSLGADLVEAALSGQSPINDFGFLGLTLGAGLVSTTLAHGAGTLVTSSILTGRPSPGLGRSLVAFLPLMLRALGTALLFLLFFFGGLILLIVPGLMVLARWYLAASIVVLEGLTPSNALARSSRLSEGYRWRILVVALLTLGLLFLLATILQLPLIVLLNSVRGGVTPQGFAATTAIASFLASTLVDPLITITGTVLYYDIRVRKEGFDLTHMLAEIDRPAEPVLT